MVQIAVAPVANVRPDSLLQILSNRLKGTGLVNDMSVLIKSMVAFIEVSDSDKLNTMQLLMGLGIFLFLLVGSKSVKAALDYACEGFFLKHCGKHVLSHIVALVGQVVLPALEAVSQLRQALSLHVLRLEMKVMVPYSEVLLMGEVLAEEPESDLRVKVGVVVLPGAQSDRGLFEDAAPDESLESVLLETKPVEELLPNLE